jgi:choice-of-anchor B domain-containing protein
LIIIFICRLLLSVVGQSPYIRPVQSLFSNMRLSILLFILLVSGLQAQNTNVTLRSKIAYPSQTLANIYGYTQNGREYALLGGAKGLIIVDITNPDNPVEITQVPGPTNLWKEIKTYGHYAYVVTEGGQGIQVVDLSPLPDPNLLYHQYRGDGAILNQLNKIHALHIDVTKGYLYAYGGDLFSGGVKVFNLNPDPYNPVYVGKFDQLGYVHDGYVDNDTMYAGHIYAGYFSVVNMADKTNPELISTQQTPNQFTHNTWLTDDRKHLLTTDERNNSFLACYDVSDPEDIKLLDAIQSNPGTNSMVHNTHVRDNYAVTSWYKDGITIVDVSRPHNLVQTGNYDTYAGSGGGSEGCWGVYPFFPSGTLVASNITAQGTSNGELWVLTPNYVRGCYLEGTVRDAVTGFPVFGAGISVPGSTIAENTNALGNFAGGQLQPGNFSATVSKTGYQSYEEAIQLRNGQLWRMEVELFPEGALTINGTVLNGSDQLAVEGAAVWLYGANGTYSAISDANGHFTIVNVKPGYYDVAATEPDFGSAILYQEKMLVDGAYTLELYKDFKRDGLDAEAWPNPFDQSFTFMLKNLDRNDRLPRVLRVFDAQGQLIQSTAATPGLPLTLGRDWPSGLFFIQAGEQTIKVVKE